MIVKESVGAILARAAAGGRISSPEAERVCTQADLLALGRAAAARCRHLHRDRTATFLIDRNINYTNICENRCRFCAFYRDAGSAEAYLLDHDEILTRIGDAVRRGATQIMIQGGLHPDLDIDWFTTLFRRISSAYDVSLHSLSPPEIVHLASRDGITVRRALQVLHEAGLSSLPGGGAEILVDRVRQHVSPKKISSAKWLSVMEEAHRLELPTTATMMIGAGEDVAERFEHLQQIRDLQDRTGGFISFIPWTFQSGNTELGGGGASVVAYLRLLATSRLFLDNIHNIQGSWVTQGPEVGQLALEFGANDLGSIMLEENVVRAAGTAYTMSKDEMVNLILATGRSCARRDTFFNRVENCG